MKVLIIAHVNSKKARIEKDLTGDLHVYVSEPALEGRANKAIIKSLAEYFKTKENKIFLIKGMKSKIKEFEVD